MSELKEERWAVISYRGIEASGLSYDAALNLMRTLEDDGIYGLCVVTDKAAQLDADTRMSRTGQPTND